ncbi:hypothetical protein P8452_15524 [Trifolium repens]|nr:hypothetical protein P8452_15524 [Trifolium repens]
MVSWTDFKFRLQVLSFYEGSSASYTLYRKLNISIIENESLKELSLIVNGVVMSYITTQAAAETWILSTEVAMTKPCDLQININAEFLWFHGVISNSAFWHFWFKYKSQERWRLYFITKTTLHPLNLPKQHSISLLFQQNFFSKDLVEKNLSGRARLQLTTSELRLSVIVPSVSSNALGYGAFLGIYANLRYQLLCGFDRGMVRHFDVIGVPLFFSTAFR